MTKFLKTFGAILMVVSGAITTTQFFVQPISYSSALSGIVGVLLLYPAVIGYVNMFDNIFGE